MNCYIGIDAGNENIKAVVTNRNKNIIYKNSVPTKTIINDIKYIFKSIKENIPDDYQIYNIGVTGENRFIVGKFLTTDIIINEIECIYEYAKHKELEGNILELSSDNSKVLSIQNSRLIDYQIYKSSNIININFLYKVATLLQININEINLIKEDITFYNNNLLLLYEEIKELNNKNVNKNIIMSSLIKQMLNSLPTCNYILSASLHNKSILKYLKANYISEEKYYLAVGASLIAQETKSNKTYSLDIENNTIKRDISKCNKCPMQCEIVSIYRNHELIDTFGNNCNKGKLEEFKHPSFS